ncbi:MAG: hypothetical protein MUW56_07385 [Chryseobacterium sp.]|uniref:hypothetical protein n=1 Tax=Chryseobacterium sp. TaxID=1871047 RepID=UPI0025B7B2AF|nr:hypothetical protein [Chryseobacterium sp.]MCJ7933448.1 hypothetical protein [Chryseobacterium sp.]
MSVNQGNIKKAMFIILAIISSWAFSAVRTDSLSVYKIKNFNGLGKIYISEGTKISGFIDLHLYISEEVTPNLENTVYVSGGTGIIGTVYGDIIYKKTKERYLEYSPNLFFEVKSHTRFIQIQYYFTQFNNDNALRGPPYKCVFS